MVCFGMYTKTDNLASYLKLKRNKKKSVTTETND